MTARPARPTPRPTRDIGSNIAARTEQTRPHQPVGARPPAASPLLYKVARSFAAGPRCLLFVLLASLRSPSRLRRVARDEPSQAWTSRELGAHICKEFSPHIWLLDSMLERTGFTIIERNFRRSVDGAYTCALSTP